MDTLHSNPCHSKMDLSQAGWGMQLIEKATNLFTICLDNTILYMNNAGIQLLQLDKCDDIVGHPFVDLIHNDYKDFLAFGLEVLAEEDDFVPLKIMTFKGESLDVKLKVNELLVGDQVGYVVEMQNFTEYKRASEAVRDREHRLKSILNAVTEGIMTFNRDCIIQTFNPAAEKIFGISSQDVIGQNIEILMPEQDRISYNVLLKNKVLQGNSNFMGKLWELNGLHKDGHSFPLEMTITKLQLGNELIFTSVFRDITERKQSEERIRHLAHHDQLTGLPNRHLFNDRLLHALKISKRYEKTLVLMFIDLDKFKPINDTLGHEAGDVVLKELASRFKAIVRDSDTVARIGGDEFVVLLEELESIDPGIVVAEKILESFKKPVMAAGRECLLGASIGIASYPDSASEADDLMRCADEAMYEVKTHGRNNYKVYEPDLDALQKKA